MLLIVYILVVIATIIFKLPLGVLFLASLFALLYTVMLSIQRDTKLSRFGIVLFIASLLCTIYSSLVIFMDYNLLQIIFK